MQKIILLDAETSNLPTRKLQPVNAYMYGPSDNFKKDIRLHFNCEIYFLVHVFLHLSTGEMPSCGISSWYALFVKVQKDLRKKIQYLVADEKDRFQLLLTSPLLNKVQSKTPLTDKS